MLNIKKIAFLIFALGFFPVIAFAGNAVFIIGRVGGVVGAAATLLVAVALVFFILGVIKYITAGDSEEGRKNARNTIVWGVGILFVTISVWGLVRVLADTFSMGDRINSGEGIVSPGYPTL